MLYSTGVPRIGSSSDASTAAVGNVTAQRRTASATLRTLPLSTTASSIAGAGEVDRAIGMSGFTANSTSVAKNVLSDNNGERCDSSPCSEEADVTATNCFSYIHRDL